MKTGGVSLTPLLKEIREGRLSNDPAVIALAHAVKMLGLRIQYLQSTTTALAGGQIVKDHDFLKSRPVIKSKNPDRGLRN
jgi:hypothetical protein